MYWLITFKDGKKKKINTHRWFFDYNDYLIFQNIQKVKFYRWFTKKHYVTILAIREKDIKSIELINGG